VNLSLDRIDGIVRIGGRSFCRFGDKWSEVAFLIAAILTLSIAFFVFAVLGASSRLLELYYTGSAH
jgi:hypothetical protein